MCRAADAAGSPAEKLETALDAMHNQQATFYGRYTIASSVERRAGGQGIVQFAAIAGSLDRVRPLLQSAYVHNVAHS